MGLFEDIPFRPPQGGHVTHVWDDSAIQRKLYVLCVSQNVYKDSKIHVLDRVRVHFGSRYHIQCTDVMGVIAEQCAIIVICSVKLRVQTLHAFHIEG